MVLSCLFCGSQDHIGANCPTYTPSGLRRELLEPPKVQLPPPQSTVIDPVTTKCKELLAKLDNWRTYTNPRDEKEFEGMVISRLEVSFPNIEPQAVLDVDSKIDARIGDIGVEIKYDPDMGKFDQIYGQVTRYLEHLKHVVIVIFSSDADGDKIKRFKHRLQKGNLIANADGVSVGDKVSLVVIRSKSVFEK